MTTTSKKMTEAMNAGYSVTVIINGEYYDFEPENNINISPAQITETITEILNDGQPRNNIQEKTNIINAEYALGKAFALLELLEKYSFSDMADYYSREDIQKLITSLTNTVEKIY